MTVRPTKLHNQATYLAIKMYFVLFQSFRDCYYLGLKCFPRAPISEHWSLLVVLSGEVENLQKWYLNGGGGLLGMGL